MTNPVRQDMNDTFTECDLAKTELKHQCKELWSRLQQLQLEIASCQIQASSESAGSSSSLQSWETTKDKQLLAQINTLENAKLPALPDNPYLLGEILKSELTAEVDQLKETEQLVRTQRSELEEEFARVNEMKAQILKFKMSLEEKVKAVSSTTTFASGQALTDLQEKNAKLRSLNSLRLRQMKDFLQEHYPVPSAEQLKNWIKTHDHGSKMSHIKLLSMHTITEQLMKRYTDCPDDPYVTLDDTFWPPYIELLLRCGIALRHPEVSQKIRLTSYDM